MPRAEGPSETQLSVHSRLGVGALRLHGTTLGNPYRLRHSVRARLPVNGSFEFPLTLHNPHAERLHVTGIVPSDQDVVVTRGSLDAVSIS